MMSCPVLAEENDPFKNIKPTEKGYELTKNQFIKLANYIAELKASKEKAEAKLEQAMIELEKAYNEDNDIIKRVGDGLTGAGLAALIVLIAQGLGGG